MLTNRHIHKCNLYSSFCWLLIFDAPDLYIIRTYFLSFFLSFFLPPSPPPARADVMLPSPRSGYCLKSHETGLCSHCNGLFLYKMHTFCVTVHNNRLCALCNCSLLSPSFISMCSHVWPQVCVVSGQSHRGVILHVWPLLEPRDWRPWNLHDGYMDLKVIMPDWHIWAVW